MTAAWADIGTTILEDPTHPASSHLGGWSARSDSRITTSSIEPEPFIIDVEREREPDPRWDLAQSALRQIAMLREDWDGAGALPIQSGILQACNRLLNRYMRSDEQPPDRIVPSPDGSVFFAWSTDAGLIEAEIDEPTTVEFTIPRKGRAPRRLTLKGRQILVTCL